MITPEQQARNQKLKEEYKEHFSWPDFIQKFLGNILNTPTFNRVRQRLTSWGEDKHALVYLDEEKGVFPVLAFDWRFYDEYHVFDKPRVLDCPLTFGATGRYKHDQIVSITINLEKREAHMTDGICVGFYCNATKQHDRPVPKKLLPFLEELYNDYDKWKSGN